MLAMAAVREAGLLRQRGTRHGPVYPNRMQSHALIVVSGTLQVAARELRPLIAVVR